MAKNSIRRLFSLMQKRFLETSATVSSTSSVPITSSSSPSSFTVEFLTKSCGLPLGSAVSASKKLQLKEEDRQKPQSVLEFLKSHHFSDTHIAKLIEKRPTVLQCKIENNLKPKFEFLIENGFEGQVLHEFIVSNPVIFCRALDAHIKPTFEILKSFLDSNEKLAMALKRSSWLLLYDLKSTVQPNVEFLIKEGVPANAVTRMILLQPYVKLQKHDRMVYAVNAVKNLGFQPKAPMFMEAVRIMLSMSESNWKKKMEVMKSMGWSEEEILLAFKRCPQCLGCSEEKIRIMMDFYVNTMKLEPQTVITYPKLLMYSIDKRIRPRYHVLKVLESEKLIKGNKKIVWLLTISEKNFLGNYVNTHVDRLPHLLQIYGGTNETKKKMGT